MKERLIESFGWCGVLAILSAYVLVSYEYVEPSSPMYQLLNAGGAIGVMIDAWYDGNYQPVVLNFVWFGIAITALLQIFW